MFTKKSKIALAGCLSLLLTQSPFAVASSSASNATAQSAQGDQLKMDHEMIKQSPNDKRDYKIIRLGNKLEVLLISDPDLKNSAASLSVPIGSMHNPDRQLGLAHYLEHMLFLGSERYPVINEYSKFMSQNGGYTNAYTAQDKTVYGFEVNDKAFDEALDRLGDVMRKPLLDKKYADKERHTVNAENETYLDNDMRKLYALQRYTLNPDYPTARFSTGDLTTLVDKKGSILQVELEAFFKAHYSANLMKVALTSPRSIDDLEIIASQYLSQIPNNEAAKPIIITPMVTKDQLAIKVEMKPTANIKLLQVNFLVPTVKDEYMYKSGAFISRLLGSDHKGGLSDNLKEAGLADMVMSGFSGNYSELYSQFSIQFKLTDKGVEQQDAILATLYAYIDLVKKEGINEQQYNALKKNLDTSFKYLNKQSGFNYVMAISANMQSYPSKDILFYPYRLDAFKKMFITQLMDGLTPSNSRVFELSPTAKGGTQIPYYIGEYNVSKISQKQQQKWLTDAKKIKLTLPSENKWVAENLQLLPKTSKDQALKILDKPGNTIWFQNSAYLDQPKANITVQLNSDIADRSVKHRAAMALMLDMLTKHFVDLNFETQEAGMSFFIDNANGLTFSAIGYSDKQIELLLTLIEQTKSAKFSEQSLRLAKNDIARRINNKQKGAAMQFAMNALSKLISEPVWSDKTMLSEIESINMSDIESLKLQIFEASSLRILALGNITKEQALLLNTEVKKIVKINEQPFYSANRIQVNLKQGAINYQLKSVMKDDALAVVYLTDQKSKKAKATSELLNQLVKPAFYDQIRTQEQLTYSPFSMNVAIDKQVGFALFTQTPTVSNAELYARFNAFIALFKTKLSKFDESEFNKIKKAHIANYHAKPASLNEEFDSLSADWYSLEEDINGRNAYIEVLSSVSLDDVKSFYNDVLVDQKQTQLMIIQVQGQRFKTKPLLKLKSEVIVTDIETLKK